MKDISDPEWKNCYDCLLDLNCKREDRYHGGCPSYKTELTPSEKRAWDRMEAEEAEAYWNRWGKHFTWEYVRKFSFGIVVATAPFYMVPIFFCLIERKPLHYYVLWFMFVGIPILFTATYWNYHAEYKIKHGMLTSVPTIRLRTFFRKALHLLYVSFLLPLSIWCWITSPYYIYRFIMSILAIDRYWTLRVNYDRGITLGVKYSEEWF